MAFLQGEYYRDTWAEIQLDHIEENVRAIINHLPNSTELMAVVKANAYGHGALEVAQSAIQAGAKVLGVAFLDEGIYLRKKGINVPILVLGYCPPEYARIAAKYSISLTVYQSEWIKSIGDTLNAQLNLHIKCDTGMSRIGIQTPAEYKELEELINKHPFLHLEGIFTHFAKADSLNNDYYQEQLQDFKRILEDVNDKPRWIHASNSAATLRFTDGLFNLTRSGITIYGLSPSDEIKNHLPVTLKPALSLHSKLIHVKKVKRGTKISYGCTYTSSEDEWIGTIPVGYADGWIRALQGQEVLINGVRVPIVGRICMDQCMVKLPNYIPVGTKVTLIGKQGSEEITADDIANKLQTINYEVVCMISHRVPRIYKSGRDTLNISNPLINDEID